MAVSGAGRIRPRFERRRYRQRLPRQQVLRSAGNIRERPVRGGRRGGGDDVDGYPDLRQLTVPQNRRRLDRDMESEDDMEFAEAMSDIDIPTFEDAAENYNTRERLDMAGQRANELYTTGRTTVEDHVRHGARVWTNAAAATADTLAREAQAARPQFERGVTTLGNVAAALPGQVTRGVETARPYAERGLANLLDATDETARETIDDAAGLIGTLENLQPTIDNLLYIAPDAVEAVRDLATQTVRSAGTALQGARQTAAAGVRNTARVGGPLLQGARQAAAAGVRNTAQLGRVALQAARDNMPRLPTRRNEPQLSESELEELQAQGLTVEDYREGLRVLQARGMTLQDLATVEDPADLSMSDEPENARGGRFGTAVYNTGRALIAGMGNLRFPTLPTLDLRPPVQPRPEDPGPSNMQPPADEQEELMSYEDYEELSDQQTAESERQAREREEAGKGEFAGPPPRDAPRPASPARVAEPTAAVRRALTAGAATVRAGQQQILRGPRMFRNSNTRNVNLGYRFDPPPPPPVIPQSRTMNQVAMTDAQRDRWIRLSQVMGFDPNDIPPHFDADHIRDPATFRGTDRPGERRFTILEPPRHGRRETREEIYQYQHAR